MQSNLWLAVGCFIESTAFPTATVSIYKWRFLPAA